MTDKIEDKIDILGLLRVIWAAKFIFLIAFLASMLTSAVYLRNATPQYIAKAVIENPASTESQNYNNVENRALEIFGMGKREEASFLPKITGDNFLRPIITSSSYFQNKIWIEVSHFSQLPMVDGDA